MTFAMHSSWSLSAAYYNAGSAALVLVLIALGIGLFLYFRQRRRSRGSSLKLKEDGMPEESIPLSRSIGMNGHGENGDYKGKGRAQGEPIFDVGSDDEGDYKDDTRQP